MFFQISLEQLQRLSSAWLYCQLKPTACMISHRPCHSPPRKCPTSTMWDHRDSYHTTAACTHDARPQGQLSHNNCMHSRCETTGTIITQQLHALTMRDHRDSYHTTTACTHDVRPQGQLSHNNSMHSRCETTGTIITQQQHALMM